MRALSIYEKQTFEPHEENMRVLLGPQGKECLLKQDPQITNCQRKD